MQTSWLAPSSPKSCGGRTDCLEELVAWAQHHGHDISEIRNMEERDILAGETRGLTCLELLGR